MENQIDWEKAEEEYTEWEIPIFDQHIVRGFGVKWIINKMVNLKSLRETVGSLSRERILLTFAWVCRQGLGYRHPYYVALRQALV